MHYFLAASLPESRNLIEGEESPVFENVLFRKKKIQCFIPSLIVILPITCELGGSAEKTVFFGNFSQITDPPPPFWEPLL